MTQSAVERASALERAIVGLRRSGGLEAAAAEALRAISGPIERYPAARAVSPVAGEPRTKWMLSGWACEMRVLPDGRRQIYSFALPGDVVLSRPVNVSGPCSLVALTPIECVDVAHLLSRARKPDRDEISKAMNRALHEMQERRYEAIVRLGRRSAVQRVADLLLELHDRLSDVGLVSDDGFRLPLTQEHFADALGLSVVHVNRSLRTLRLNKLVNFRFGRASGFDRAGLITFSQSSLESLPRTAFAGGDPAAA
ncbi:Crp/Fnr family transcriptional regulator [Phenylobacterium deserti]|nr:Crp/Fnr family transcriptional regulator [Phenylobacterium deserti]